jgi:hypothetical protein
MKIIIVITVVETLMLTLWLAYSYYRHRKSNVRIALGRPGPTIDYRDGSLLSPSPGHGSAINRSQVQGQQDDRRLMNGSVPVSKEVAASVHRALARKSHQVMYKKWSKDRHED